MLRHVGKSIVRVALTIVICASIVNVRSALTTSMETAVVSVMGPLWRLVPQRAHARVLRYDLVALTSSANLATLTAQLA